MVIIRDYEDESNLVDGNSIQGTFPKMINSKIVFRGKGNILYCEEGVTLENTSIDFARDNALIYLGKSRFNYKLNVYTNYGCVLSIGRNNYINDVVQVILSEHKHVFIGSDGMFSMNVCFRNSDAHLIYDVSSKKRVNPTKSIFVGDHVWFGQDSSIFKGSRIASGAIIGAGAVSSNKTIEHNSSYGGNPIQKIKEGVFWNGCCVHPWDTDMTNKSADYNVFIENYFKGDDVEKWIYEIDNKQSISWDKIENTLDLNEINEKISFIRSVYNDKNKNRFCCF